MSELPIGWVNTILEKVADWGSGGTPSRSHADYYGGSIPWIKTGELGKGLIVDTEETITQVALDNSSAKLFPKGSVALAMYGATIGKVAILGIDAATNQACAVGTPVPGITITKYLFHYLASQKAEFVAKGQGGAQPNISQTIIRTWPIPLAPLMEQQRIASKLDLLVTKVDGCRERLDRVPQILKKFREAVLESAVSGRLTEEWRHSTKGPSWTSSSINDLCSTTFDGPFGSNLKSADYSRSGVRVVRLENIGHLQFRGDLETFISRSKYRTLEKHSLLKDDVVFSSFVDEEVRVCLIPESLGLAINKADCFCLRIAPEKALPQFVAYRLATPDTYTDMKAMVRGVTRPRINLSHLKQYEITVPPISEQAAIVRRVDNLFAIADSLQRRYASTVTQVGDLTPSVLAKAFRGELVPQDPNDEPAEKMLERIARERKDLTMVAKKRTSAVRTGTARITEAPDGVAATGTAARKVRANGHIPETLFDVLRNAGGWIEAEKAFRQCGISDGSTTEEIERLYAELREIDAAGQLLIASVRNKPGQKLSDRIRLKTA